ncbi:MAG: membrane protein insertase YidC [Oscillospiraceae bacterium]|nr:membrane protein insertase YidC [Oscillospiraceae bacterium]
MLYKLLIGPLELLFEVVFVIATRFVHTPGRAIFVLSLAINLLVLPLYKRADAVQEEERRVREKMQPWVDHIKKTFTGDERFMILQTLYRQNNYKQTDSLKGSISLLLEIPFFMAAYNFLSKLALLQGASFGPIKDLGAQDGLINWNGQVINLLPILMTVINIISASIYMKGMPLKNKIQMYGMALIFLYFLYTSPSGLVLYWTLNNVFSLFKNILAALKLKKETSQAILFVAGALGIAGVLYYKPFETQRQTVFVLVVLAALMVPFVIRMLKLDKLSDRFFDGEKGSSSGSWMGRVLLTVLTGVLIPSTIINASPAEFVNITAYKSPLWYIVSSVLLSAGYFIVWVGVYYRLSTAKGKRVFDLVIWIFTGAAIINYMFFGTNYGNISDQLQFDTVPVSSYPDKLKNLGVLLVMALIFVLIWKIKESLVKYLYLVLCLALIGMSAVNIIQTNDALASIQDKVIPADAEMPYFNLSKDGKNVIVLMLDRAASYYLPYLMYEKPEIEEKFDGFTYYPNTISYGTATNVGVPGVYGGYDYIPDAMNARPELTLGEKQNEALKLMPSLFDKEGYDVTVCDPTYAGYSWIPDLTIYDEYPNIRKYITMGRFEMEEYGFTSYFEHTEQVRSRNFFCYSIFKISPLFVQPTIYADGDYNSSESFSSAIGQNSVGTNAVIQTRENLSKATGMDERFMNSYAVLDNLPEMTHILDDDTNTFLMMSNDTTHQPILLKEPEYVPSLVVDNTEYDAEHAQRYAADGTYVTPEDTTKMIHYHANMAALLKLGDYFDYLRENGVYDNTRIIIVSDHAWSLWQNKDMMLWIRETPDSDLEVWDMSMFNCMLLVKDFNATGFTVDRTFMTNADTPSLAFEGLIDNPVNPFTGNPVDSSTKDLPEQHMIYAQNWEISTNNGNTYLPDYWFSVHDDIYVHDNWKFMGIF